MESIIVYILLVQSFCVVFSNAPNSKLMDRVEILEKDILKEKPMPKLHIRGKNRMFGTLCKEMLDYGLSRPIYELVKQFCFWSGQCNHSLQF